MLRTELKLFDARLKDLITYGSALAAGLDLRACSVTQIHNGERKELTGDGIMGYTLYPGEKVLVGSGIAVYLASTVYAEPGQPEYGLDEEFYTLAAMLLPRSGLGTKLDIRLANTVGLIDADYQGEILMAVQNGGDTLFQINALDRLVQMVVVPVVRPSFTVVEDFSKPTERGEGGFGSTGKG